MGRYEAACALLAAAYVAAPDAAIREPMRLEVLPGLVGLGLEIDLVSKSCRSITIGTETMTELTIAVTAEFAFRWKQPAEARMRSSGVATWQKGAHA